MRCGCGCGAVAAPAPAVELATFGTITVALVHHLGDRSGQCDHHRRYHQHHLSPSSSSSSSSFPSAPLIVIFFFVSIADPCTSRLSTFGALASPFPCLPHQAATTTIVTSRRGASRSAASTLRQRRSSAHTHSRSRTSAAAFAGAFATAAAVGAALWIVCSCGSCSSSSSSNGGCCFGCWHTDCAIDCGIGGCIDSYRTAPCTMLLARQQPSVLPLLLCARSWLRVGLRETICRLHGDAALRAGSSKPDRPVASTGQSMNGPTRAGTLRRWPQQLLLWRHQWQRQQTSMQWPSCSSVRRPADYRATLIADPCGAGQLGVPVHCWLSDMRSGRVLVHRRPDMVLSAQPPARARSGAVPRLYVPWHGPSVAASRHYRSHAGPTAGTSALLKPLLFTVAVSVPASCVHCMRPCSPLTPRAVRAREGCCGTVCRGRDHHVRTGALGLDVAHGATPSTAPRRAHAVHGSAKLLARRPAPVVPVRDGVAVLRVARRRLMRPHSGLRVQEHAGIAARPHHDRRREHSRLCCMARSCVAAAVDALLHDRSADAAGSIVTGTRLGPAPARHRTEPCR